MGNMLPQLFNSIGSCDWFIWKGDTTDTNCVMFTMESMAEYLAHRETKTLMSVLDFVHTFDIFSCPTAQYVTQNLDRFNWADLTDFYQLFWHHQLLQLNFLHLLHQLHQLQKLFFFTWFFYTLYQTFSLQFFLANLNYINLFFSIILVLNFFKLTVNYE